uniref:Uncharacterized protein n=1 Tax=Romanomermis culicivorax TaxID=13658 RepID=A0A915JCX0_ROMCU
MAEAEEETNGQSLKIDQTKNDETECFSYKITLELDKFKESNHEYESYIKITKAPIKIRHGNGTNAFVNENERGKCLIMAHKHIPAETLRGTLVLNNLRRMFHRGKVIAGRERSRNHSAGMLQRNYTSGQACPTTYKPSGGIKNNKVAIFERKKLFRKEENKERKSHLSRFDMFYSS